MHLDTSEGLAPITCSVKAAVAATGLGKDTIYKMMDDGRLESSTVGGRRLIFIDSLRAYIESCRVKKAAGGMIDYARLKGVVLAKPITTEELNAKQGEAA